jgi:phage terminase small subunit
MEEQNMPRISRAELAVIPLGPVDHRLQPPADMGSTEAALFRYLVASLPPSHFVEADRPLLTLYCEAVCLARRSAAGLSKKPELIPIWERAARLATQMSSKLRLCPSSRLDAKTAHRAAADYQLSYYDRLKAERGHD